MYVRFRLFTSVAFCGVVENILALYILTVTCGVSNCFLYLTGGSACYPAMVTARYRNGRRLKAQPPSTNGVQTLPVATIVVLLLLFHIFTVLCPRN